MEKVHQPLISFIIPCYNLPPSMVEECITSILDLSLDEDEREIIVIDDGSDDLLIDHIPSLTDKIVYIRQANKGLSVSRNVGIDVSKGRYIQFVDGDDRLIKAGYEYCLDIIRREKSDMVLFNNSADKKEKNVSLNPECETGSHFMTYNSLHAAAWGYVFNRDILQNLRFTAGIYHEDEEFTPLLMLRAERLYNTKVTAYYYRTRSGSITNSITDDAINKRLDDMEYVIYSLYDKSSIVALTERKALERRVAQLTVAYIYQIIKLTHSSEQLNNRLGKLKKRGLFPLPNNKYNWKYSLFRMLSGNRILKNILLLFVR